jgi:hypothetical protein
LPTRADCYPWHAWRRWRRACRSWRPSEWHPGHGSRWRDRVLGRGLSGLMARRWAMPLESPWPVGAGLAVGEHDGDRVSSKRRERRFGSSRELSSTTVSPLIARSRC